MNFPPFNDAGYKRFDESTQFLIELASEDFHAGIPQKLYDSWLRWQQYPGTNLGVFNKPMAALLLVEASESEEYDDSWEDRWGTLLRAYIDWLADQDAPNPAYSFERHYAQARAEVRIWWERMNLTPSFILDNTENVDTTIPFGAEEGMQDDDNIEAERWFKIYRFIRDNDGALPYIENGYRDLELVRRLMDEGVDYELASTIHHFQ